MNNNKIKNIIYLITFKNFEIFVLESLKYLITAVRQTIGSTQDDWANRGGQLTERKPLG